MDRCNVGQKQYKKHGCTLTIRAPDDMLLTQTQHSVESQNQILSQPFELLLHKMSSSFSNSSTIVVSTTVAVGIGLLLSHSILDYLDRSKSTKSPPIDKKSESSRESKLWIEYIHSSL